MREVKKITAIEKQRAEAVHQAVGTKMEVLDKKKIQIKKDVLMPEK